MLTHRNSNSLDLSPLEQRKRTGGIRARSPCSGHRSNASAAAVAAAAHLQVQSLLGCKNTKGMQKVVLEKEARMTKNFFSP